MRTDLLAYHALNPLCQWLITTPATTTINNWRWEYTYTDVPGTGDVPNSKTDWKMAGTFGEHPNYQWHYPNGTWEEQQAIVAEFKR